MKNIKFGIYGGEREEERKRERRREGAEEGEKKRERGKRVWIGILII